MPIKTRITDMLGIEKPIIQAAMGWIARAPLSSAVIRAQFTALHAAIDAVPALTFRGAFVFGNAYVPGDVVTSESLVFAG